MCKKYFFCTLPQDLFHRGLCGSRAQHAKRNERKCKCEKKCGCIELCAGSFLVAERRKEGRRWLLFGVFKLSGARGIPKECVPNSKPLLSPPPLHLPQPSKPLCSCCVATEQQLGHEFASLYLAPCVHRAVFLRPLELCKSLKYDNKNWSLRQMNSEKPLKYVMGSCQSVNFVILQEV